MAVEPATRRRVAGRPVGGPPPPPLQIRSKAITLRLFCKYIVDAAYGWPQECWARFGTHPGASRLNTATHVQEAEGRAGLGAFTPDELQALFDCADGLVVTTRQRGRKRWLSAFRDATLLEVFSALCEILACSPADLLEVHAAVRQRRVAPPPASWNGSLRLRPGRGVRGPEESVVNAWRGERLLEWTGSHGG